jgi:hypothetical protein
MVSIAFQGTVQQNVDFNEIRFLLINLRFIYFRKRIVDERVRSEQSLPQHHRRTVQLSQARVGRIPRNGHLHCLRKLALSLKGQCHGIFCFRFFFINHLFPSP